MHDASGADRKKRKRDWRLAAEIPISVTATDAMGIRPINGDNHEDLERTAGARAGRWSRSYELSTGRDRSCLADDTALESSDR